MPGAFAHITLASECTGTDSLDLYNLHSDAYEALLSYSEFCELGAVSPDYPYLTPYKSQTIWADHVHINMKTQAILFEGIKAVKEIENFDEKQKAFAWLAGFISHIIADVIIHPVVEKKVGPYDGNEKAHRICEMHQDAYIYQRLKIGPMGMAEKLESGVAQCCDMNDSKRIDPTIEKVWRRMLQAIVTDEAQANEAKIDTWHEWFCHLVSTVEETNKLFPLARHIAVNIGLGYPSKGRIKDEYIYNLDDPIGGKMDYDAIFDKAMNEVGYSWKVLGETIFSDKNEYKKYFANWNLDTGRDVNNTLVFWYRSI